MTGKELTEKIEALRQKVGGNTSVISKNLKTDETFSFNEMQDYNAASIIKLPVLCTCYWMSEDGRLSLQDRHEVTSAHVRAGGMGVLKDLGNGITPSLHDLMTLMVILSDNFATNMCIDACGIENIKDFCEKKGLPGLRLQRKLMDTEAMNKGFNNFCVANDVAKLLEGLGKKTLLSPENCDDAIDIMLRQQCNNKMPSKVVDRWDAAFERAPIKIAHKTGDMPKIEHDVGIVYLGDEAFTLSVFTEHVDNVVAVDFIGEITKYFVEYYSK